MPISATKKVVAVIMDARILVATVVPCSQRSNLISAAFELQRKVQSLRCGNCGGKSICDPPVEPDLRRHKFTVRSDHLSNELCMTIFARAVVTKYWRTHPARLCSFVQCSLQFKVCVAHVELKQSLPRVPRLSIKICQNRSRRTMHENSASRNRPGNLELSSRANAHVKIRSCVHIVASLTHQHETETMCPTTKRAKS